MNAKRLRFLAAAALFLGWVLTLAAMAVTTSRQPRPGAAPASGVDEPAR